MNTTSILALATWLLLVPSVSAAQGISGIVSDNRSSANSSESSTYEATEFGSQLSSGPAVLEGNVASFTHRMAWFGGVALDRVGLAVDANIYPALAYSVTFTVEDRLDRGYTLRLDSELRGALVALVGGLAKASSELKPVGVTALAAFEPLPIELPELTSQAHSVVAGGLRVLDGLDIDDTARAEVGHWTGTRSFQLSVQADPFALYARLISPLATSGLAFMQFGVAPRAPLLEAGAYTGTGSPSINDLGHFLHVQAVYDMAPVPEPAGALLLVCGLAALGSLRRLRGTLGAT